MIAADIVSMEELARRSRVPVTLVQGWLDTQGESMTLRQALAVRRVLHVRGQWLLDGAGSMVSLQSRKYTPEFAQVIEKLPPDKAEYLLHIARRWAR